MIEWLRENFPEGKNYLVCQRNREQINSYMMDHLVAPFQVGKKHNLWGEIAKKLPSIGQKIGWVPNKMPATFLSESVELELADALAAQENSLRPQKKHLEAAKELLNSFNMVNLAHRNPFFLSNGEAKILWFLTQWAKKPEYLIIGYLPTGLSKPRIYDLINCFIETSRTYEKYPGIILGYQLDYIEWCKTLIYHKEWEIIPQWPE